MDVIKFKISLREKQNKHVKMMMHVKKNCRIRLIIMRSTLKNAFIIIIQPNDSDNLFGARIDDLKEKELMPNKDRFMTAVD